MRDHPEKLAILEFPQFIGPTLVTRSADDVRAFHAEHRDIILKPLDGMGGMGIFRVGADGLNLGSITETLNRDGAQTLMVQRYLPEIVAGRQAHPGDRRRAGAVLRWRASRRAARSAATWPPAARAWRSR